MVIQKLILSKNSAEVFKKSLICTLSLSSKELFHSNMLGWLLENDLSFARMVLDCDSLIKIEKVEREKYNVDLFVTADQNHYVIENKVKSLPNHEQIIGYKEKMDNKNQDANFVLISLVEPDDEFRSKVPFLKIINYEQIHNWLSQLETTDKYLRALLDDYGILISTLLQIKLIASDLKLEHQLSFKKEDEKILRDIRLFDVAQKIRYSCFAVLCDKRLDELKLKNLSELKEKTEVALSRSLGLISIKIKFQNPASGRPFLIGIQIQGNQYRFLVESTDGSDVQALAEELRKECLWLTSRHGTCENIRKFGKIFKYTYFLIKEKTIEDLIREVEIDITKLFENKNKIESLIIRMQSNNFHSGELNQAKL